MRTIRSLLALTLAAASAGCSDGNASPSATPVGEPSAAGGVMELVASSDPLTPGHYTRTGFEPKVTFAVDGPWHAVQLFDGFFDIQQDVGSPDVIAVQFATPDAFYGAGNEAVPFYAPPPDVEAILRANPGLTVVETSTSRIGGHDGFQITVENAGNAAAQVMRVPPGPLSILPGRRLWIALFEVDERIFAIMVGGSVAKWDAALAAAEPLLESIEIGE